MSWFYWMWILSSAQDRQCAFVLHIAAFRSMTLKQHAKEEHDFCNYPMSVPENFSHPGLPGPKPAWN